ncbi:hypothetical protein BH09GEM1_BH09GEM1_32600 [soil metagenome]
MLIKILIGVVLLVVVLAIAIATRPKTFRVERSTIIDATPDAIFPFIDDFHLWSRWSPFDKLDPNLQRTFSGPEAGKGATYEWLGNREAGQGKMVIVESEPAQRVAIDLFFLKPFKSTSLAEFTFAPGTGARRCHGQCRAGTRSRERLSRSSRAWTSTWVMRSTKACRTSSARSKRPSSRDTRPRRIDTRSANFLAGAALLRLQSSEHTATPHSSAAMLSP